MSPTTETTAAGGTPGDRAYLMRTYAEVPVTFVRGEGTTLFDTDGRAYLDFITGLAVVSLGHAHPAVTQAVGDQIEVLLDGGIRRGSDVVKAVALGARGTLIGRSFLYGLGAMGQAGVTKALEIIAKELEITMAFCGHTDIRQVDRHVLLPGTYPT